MKFVITILVFTGILGFSSCKKDESRFIEIHQESIRKTSDFITKYRTQNGKNPTSRICHDWIITQNIHNNSGITILNVKFQNEDPNTYFFEIFDGEDWVYVYNPKTKTIEDKILFSKYK